MATVKYSSEYLALVTEATESTKLGKENSNSAFEIPNTPEGLATIEQLRTIVNREDGYSILPRTRGKNRVEKMKKIGANPDHDYYGWKNYNASANFPRKAADWFAVYIIQKTKYNKGTIDLSKKFYLGAIFNLDGAGNPKILKDIITKYGTPPLKAELGVSVAPGLNPDDPDFEYMFEEDLTDFIVKTAKKYKMKQRDVITKLIARVQTSVA